MRWHHRLQLAVIPKGGRDMIEWHVTARTKATAKERCRNYECRVTNYAQKQDALDAAHAHFREDARLPDYEIIKCKAVKR